MCEENLPYDLYDEIHCMFCNNKKECKKKSEEHSGSIRFPFRCIECGYGMSLTSGVPAECPICKGFLCFVRITWDEYQKLKTTDGFDEK